MTTKHNPAYQIGFNGPLTPALRNRIEAVKNKQNLTLKKMGTKFDFTGSFLSTLLRDVKPARIRTQHIDRVVAALELMENPQRVVQISRRDQPNGDLVELIKAAHGLGFEVSFKPLS